MNLTPNEPVSPEIDEALSELNRRRFKAYTPETLAWLASPPAWTENLAFACSFPTGGMNLDELLERAAKAKLCARDAETKLDEAICEAARSLASLWPYLDRNRHDQYRDVLEKYALGIPDREEGICLLISAASSEGGSPLEGERLTSLIGEVSDHEVQARLLLQLALHFSQPEYLMRAWKAADSIRVPLQRTIARVALSEKASSMASLSWYERVTATAEEVQALAEPKQRALLLLRLDSTNSDSSLRQRILSAIQEIADPSTRALYLSLLARSAPGSEYGSRAFEIASSLPDAALRCRTLATIAANCGDALAVEALNLAWASASNVQDSAERMSLLVLTASQWAPLQRDAVLSRVQDLKPAECRAEVMLACLSAEPLRTPATADVISSTIEEIPLKSMRTRLLLRLASLVPSLQRPDVLALARSIQDDAERRNSLLSLLPCLNEKDRPAVATELLDDLRRVDAEIKRSALIQLAPFLDEKQLSQALQLLTNPQTDRGFRVEDIARREILDYLRKENGGLFLYNIAFQAGQAITAAKNISVPVGTARWARLASLLGDANRSTFQRVAAAAGIGDVLPTSSAGPFLANQVREFVDAGDTGSALAWLSAGQMLVSVSGGDVESAVLTGKHRVELSYRRSMDERHLRRYLERTEQTAAFVSLRDGPDSHWALHYLGVGGVGKTMLLRHITARLAMKDGQRLATTRVDFDHIGPEYPVRKPGQLLAELADELRIYGGSSRLEDKFAEFQDRLLTLHAELSTQPPPEDLLKNVRSPAFHEVVSSFADLLRLLPPPVILILDTCEELSKLEPIGSSLPSVEATFAILEQLQVYIPTVRVVFAGRRLLAQSGDSERDRPARWKADVSALGERNRYLPEHKEYLRLHVIRGFTGEESDRFLEQIADVQLDSDRKMAILERSTEISTPAEIQWAETHSDDDAPRYNPFDVALYADWLRESPEVTAKTIRSGETDPYVEMRIVGRLENDPTIRRALPAAVLLRRFEDEMLRPIAPDDASRAALFRDLQGHEWTDAQRDEDLATWFLEVNPNLRKRIESYYAALPRRLELDRMREQLGPALDQRVRASLVNPQWFNQLNFSRLEPALRLQLPEAAARLWDAIDQRLTLTAEWNWALRICPQLLGEGNVAGDVGSPLRAAIRATLNAAMLHTQRDFDLIPAWREVARTAPGHPVPEIAKWLAYRADTFLARDIKALRALAVQLEVLDWDPYRFEQATAGLLARVYEMGGSKEEPFVPADRWPRFGPDSDVNLLLLQELALSDNATDPPESSQVIQRWADWRIPDCLTDRVRLEQILASFAEGTRSTRSVGLNLYWARSTVERLNNIDSERLLSALLEHQLPETPPELLHRITQSQYYDPARIESCAAHRATRPLYVVLAEHWKRLGNAEQALNVVANVRQSMLRTRQPANILLQLDALEARLTEDIDVREIRPETQPTADVASRPDASRLRTALIALFGWAVIVAAAFVLFRFGRWVLGGENRLSYVGVPAGMVALWFLAKIFRKGILGIVATVLKPRLVLLQAGREIQASFLQVSNFWWPNRRKERELYKLHFYPPGSGPYRDESARLAELSGYLIKLRPRLVGGRLPVELALPAGMQQAAWEALIYARLADSQGRVREFLQFCRTAPPRRAANQVPWQASQSVALLSRSRDMASLERIWSGRVAAPQLVKFDERATAVVAPASGLRAIHMVGRTRKSSGARLFQITPDRYFTSSQIPAASVCIVVVQCQPVESFERTDTDREQIASLRGFAADLFDAGATSVIFLPQMPLAISDKVVDKLGAFCMRGRSPNRFRLLDHISEIRDLISKSISAETASSSEAGQKYTHSESAAPAEGDVVDSESLNSAREEMSMDVTVWTHLA